ncbi:MAG: porin [Geminicoccaceae bacterium]|nr:porin [Geminicoccaceae bacterium]MCS7268685.1 porin [Geminicoccaceae bacterium]MCX7630230.1 porin [Geminicoccaceae bacterium]MDW8125829.1 porin [Geminicoccaceae bacterium]MDW8341492.1 porin [Geminicoccaceae bacterium]
MATSALVAASTVLVVPSVEAQPAPKVGPVGKLDISIGGFSRFLWALGDVKAKTGAQNASSDFRNDTEVHIVARGKDESTGIEYGATIEFEADTSRTDNTDETWLLLKGVFGEFRFGDEDGAADNMKVGGFSVAVGTGGIDGTVIDTPAVVGPANSDDATKIIYYSPKIGGFQLGVSYTPSSASGGDTLAFTNAGGFKDWVEAGLTYTGAFGGVGVTAAVVGGIAEADFSGPDDDLKTIFGGLQLDLFGVSLAGGIGTEEVLGIDRDWFNLGAKAEVGPVALSVTYGRANFDPGPEPHNLVFGAELGIAPGLSLSGEVSFFDEDRGGDDDGVLGLVRLGVDF